MADNESVQIFEINKDEIVANFEAIDKIFLAEDVSRNPVRLVVICGEPRIGKSTFGNVLYYDYETIDFSEEADNVHLNKVDPKQKLVLRKVFKTSNSTTKPLTNGIWITPKPIAIRFNQKLVYNAFIVDVEGIFGPNSERISHQHMFVLAALMATRFVYFVKKSFNGYADEILKSYSTLAKHIERKLQNLVVVVSDHPNQEEFDFGSNSSEDYIKSLYNDMNLDLNQFKESFRNVECFLMPEPSDKLRKGLVNDRDHVYIGDLGQEYHSYCLQFRSKYVTKINKKSKILNGGIGDFTMSNCLPSGFANANKKQPYHATGSSFKEFLKLIYQRVKSDEMIKIPNHLKLEADQHNSNKVRQLTDYYNKVMEPMLTKVVEDWQKSKITLSQDTNRIESLHQAKMNQALNEFDAFPWSTWNCSKDYFKELRKEISHSYQSFWDCLRKMDQYFEMYKNEMNAFISNFEVGNDR